MYMSNLIRIMMIPTIIDGSAVNNFGIHLQS